MNSIAWRQVLSIVNKLPKEYFTLKAAQRAAVSRPLPTPSLITCGHNHVHARPFSDDQQTNDQDEEGGAGEGAGGKKIDPSRDRRIPVDLEVGLQYMKSNAFKETYRDFKIWQLFRRNFKGVISPAKPRITCVEDGFITTSNPCVICRDRYLVVDYRNVDLLNQFISPHTGYVLPNTVICLCSEQYEKLCVAVTLAKSYGLIDFEVPLREYHYGQHYDEKQLQQKGFVA